MLSNVSTPLPTFPLKGGRGSWVVACSFAAALCVAGIAVCGSSRAADIAPLQIAGDAIPAPLTATPGDANAGRNLLVKRENANCILCHGIPEVRFFGNLAPPLAGVGARLSAAQLRLRVADNAKLNPNTIMPSYYRTERLIDVAAQYRGKTVLTAQEVEDVVAYLGTLK